MELKEGMYCFNKTNRKLGIGEIISFQSNNNVNVKYKNNIELVSIGNVIASNSIIELVQKGDYVNGHEIINIDCYEYEDELFFDTNETINSFVNEDIKSIVTKEQFESMQYRLGE